METYVHLRYFAEFFLEGEIFRTQLYRKSNHLFYVKQLFSENLPFMTECGKIWYCQLGHR